jgi:hypothetical protein
MRPDVSAWGSTVRFNFREQCIEAMRPKASHNANAFSLLNLRKRYSSSVVYRDVMLRTQRILESARRADTSSSTNEILSYHRTEYATEPLYFATRAALAGTASLNAGSQEHSHRQAATPRRRQKPEDRQIS